MNAANFIHPTDRANKLFKRVSLAVDVMADSRKRLAVLIAWHRWAQKNIVSLV